jgi:hypothetical protein
MKTEGRVDWEVGLKISWDALVSPASPVYELHIRWHGLTHEIIIFLGLRSKKYSTMLFSILPRRD